jgi:hypothetical protein
MQELSEEINRLGSLSTLVKALILYVEARTRNDFKRGLALKRGSAKGFWLEEAHKRIGFKVLTRKRALRISLHGNHYKRHSRLALTPWTEPFGRCSQITLSSSADLSGAIFYVDQLFPDTHP